MDFHYRNQINLFLACKTDQENYGELQQLQTELLHYSPKSQQLIIYCKDNIIINLCWSTGIELGYVWHLRK